MGIVDEELGQQQKGERTHEGALHPVLVDADATAEDAQGVEWEDTTIFRRLGLRLRWGVGLRCALVVEVVVVGGGHT